jgi:hypothetical protein
MRRAKLKFKETEMSRAIRAASKAGVRISRVEVDANGKISVVAARPGEGEFCRGGRENEEARS